MEEPEFNSDEPFEPLSELEKSKMEQAMLEIAYENSYMVLTKLRRQTKSIEGAWARPIGPGPWARSLGDSTPAGAFFC